ncbi:MAG: TIGR01777 family oxidoreductase [Halioglobus sp.]
MRILLTGGTGFIGEALVAALLDRGSELIILSRQARPDAPRVRFVQSLEDIASDTQLSAVINLAGASLAGQRWTASYKREIVASRIDTTRHVLALLQRLQQTPPVLLSASAIGYYGHHGDELLTETAPVTPGFAQQLCHDWEAVALQAQQFGARVCLLRLGVVLDRGGGALVEMARSFNVGVASWLGSGRQWLSWVHREDVIRAILMLLARDDLRGPFNITGPQPVTGRAFATALQAHHRTFVQMGVPATAARLLLGEMANELLLNGQRVIPQALVDADFEFAFARVDAALAAIYKR